MNFFSRLDWHWLRASREKIANRLQKICKCSYKCSLPVELSSFSVFSVFDSISSRFSLLYSAREEEILDCGSSSSLLARELKERKKCSYCFVFVPALEHNTRFALTSCTQKKKTCDAS